MKPRIDLVLFFTRGVSVHSWLNWGILEREAAVYRRLQQSGVDVSFVTYGGGRDLECSHMLPGIRLLCNRWRLPRKWYERLLPLLHARQLRSCDVVKTNQIKGAEVALRAARFWGKPLIARCGYLWSEFAARDHGPGSVEARQALEVEATIFGEASRIVVTTQQMAESILDRNHALRSKIAVIPNYVETEIFTPPNTGSACDLDLIFVGRLAPQKNIPALLQAVQSMNTRLGIVGAGPRDQEEKLRRDISTMKDKVEWLGRNIPNHDLPRMFSRAKVYILPSHFEGHPKTLIEAMACGLPVIGADSPGIREIIRHGETGWLCGTDPESIRNAIQTLLADPELRKRLGHNARQYAISNYDLSRIVSLELTVLREVVAR